MSSIYIHIPFCKQACYYCDFHFSTNRNRQEEMVQALIKEIGMRRGELEDSVIDSIYFGGGTPSVLKPVELESILKSIFANYKVNDTPEITLEANPDDLDEERLLAFKELGINRLSIGVQSFRDSDLIWMNRSHTARQVEQCLDDALKHFENVSIDLIYGIPGMTLETWDENVRKALRYNLPHLSAYALTVEQGTVLYHNVHKGKSPPMDDIRAEEDFFHLVTLLTVEGYDHYEISNFGKPGFYSRNNSAYWQGKPYMGIGPSAHSYDGNRRRWNIRNNRKYLKALEEGIPYYQDEILSKVDRYNECVMTGLRTKWGVSLSILREEFGPAQCDYLLRQATQYLREGYLIQQNDTLLVTHKGKFLVDGIASDLFMINLV